MSNQADILRPSLRKAVEKFPASVRFRAINSMDGFEKAFALFELDREMASFRAITAQEESASALFNALKWQKYPGADRLNIWNHRHKAAVWPVLHAFRIQLSGGVFSELKIILDPSIPAIRVGVPLSRFGSQVPEEISNKFMEPVHPLDLHLVSGGKTHLYQSELQEVLAAAGQSSMEGHIAFIANARNTLLYASDSSVPKSRATLNGLEARRSGGEAALYAAIMILQTPKLQSLALQVLETFLTVVDKAEGLLMPYPEPLVPDFTLESQGEDEA